MIMDEWVRQKQTGEKAYNEMSAGALCVKAFRDTLASYFIPQEEIEKYVDEFIRRRENLLFSYCSKFIDENGSQVLTAAEIIVRLTSLEYAKPGEINLEELAPVERQYLGDRFKLQTECLEKANGEYFGVKKSEEPTYKQEQPPVIPQPQQAEHETDLQREMDDLFRGNR